MNFKGKKKEERKIFIPLVWFCHQNLRGRVEGHRVGGPLALSEPKVKKDYMSSISRLFVAIILLTKIMLNLLVKMIYDFTGHYQDTALSRVSGYRTINTGVEHERV